MHVMYKEVILHSHLLTEMSIPYINSMKLEIHILPLNRYSLEHFH